MSGLGIEIRALFSGAATAAAIAAIIEHEYADAGFQQRPAHVQAVANIPGVAMAQEHSEGHARRICVSREKPAVQFDAVFGFEPDVFEGPAQFSAGCSEETVGMINLGMFKPAQHNEKEQENCQQFGEYLQCFSPLLHRKPGCIKLKLFTPTIGCILARRELQPR